MLGPLPRWLTECAYPFLPLSHRPSPKSHRVGSSTAIRSTTSEREVFRGCSHLMIFRPPSLLPPRSSPPLDIRIGCSGRPWRLRPSTARFVTSPRIGYASRPNSGAGSTGRRNTGIKSLCRGFKLQGLTWPFVELTSHFVQTGLRMHRQVGALRKVLSQQTIGVLIRAALPWALRIAKINVDVCRQ